MSLSQFTAEKVTVFVVVVVVVFGGVVEWSITVFITSLLWFIENFKSTYYYYY